MRRKSLRSCVPKGARPKQKPTGEASRVPEAKPTPRRKPAFAARITRTRANRFAELSRTHWEIIS